MFYSSRCFIIHNNTILLVYYCLILAWKISSRRDTDAWKRFYISWLKNYKGRMFLLSYSKLKDDFYNEVFRLADFLNITMTYKTLWCGFKQREGHFHRQSNVTKADVYTQKMLYYITESRDYIKRELVRVFGDAANGVF